MGMFAIHIPTYKSTGVNCWWVWPHQPLVSTHLTPLARPHGPINPAQQAVSPTTWANHWCSKYNQCVGYGHFGRQWKFHHVSLLSGWWFQTFSELSISYMGCHPSHWPIFFKMDITTNKLFISLVMQPEQSLPKRKPHKRPCNQVKSLHMQEFQHFQRWFWLSCQIDLQDGAPVR